MSLIPHPTKITQVFDFNKNRVLKNGIKVTVEKIFSNYITCSLVIL